MAGRPASGRTLGVWMNGELVGHWTIHSSAGHSFVYDAGWAGNANSRSLSLSLPLSRGPTAHVGNAVEHFFENLLPDSPAIRKRLASRFGAESAHAFALLEKIGRDCVGAIQLLPAGMAPPEVHRIDAEPLAEADIERILDDTLSTHNIGVPLEDELRISLAGAQEKTALLWHGGQWCRPRGTTPTTHILKLPMGEVGGRRADFSTSVENEWLCAQLIRAYGLSIADCEIANFGRHKVLVVQRFDRALMSGWWARLPQEDFCQALSVPPEHKYEEHGGPGIANILDMLRGSDQAELDRGNFLRAQLLFWMLAAPDGHAKNFSIFIHQGDHFQATPLYDVMSAWPVIGKGARDFSWKKIKLAMALRARNTHYRIAEIQRRHWNEVARANDMGHDFEASIERLIELTPVVIDAVATRLPAGFPECVAGPVFEGLATQAQRLKLSAQTRGP